VAGADFFRDAGASLIAALDLDAPLADRVAAIQAALSTLYVASLHLASDAPAPAAAVEPGPPVTLGSLDRVAFFGDPADPETLLEGSLGEILARIRAELVAGEGRSEAEAEAHWAAGFWFRWGRDALAALAALHVAGASFRPAPRAEPSQAPDGVVLLRDDGGGLLTAPPADGVLGVRGDAVFGGLQVTAVHPAGPAAGLLEEGDIVLEIDGSSLEGVEDDALRKRLAGPQGVEKRLAILRDGEMIEVLVAPVDPSVLASPRVVRRFRVAEGGDVEAVAGVIRGLGCDVVADGGDLEVVLPAGVPGRRVAEALAQVVAEGWIAAL
jgi:hypothetical protein